MLTNKELDFVFVTDLHIRNTEKYGKVGGTGRNTRLDDKLNHIKSSVSYCLDNNCDLWICGGDVFDKINPAENLRNLFFDCITPLIENKIPIYIVVGNHDTDSHIYSFMTEEKLFKTLNQDAIKIYSETQLETIKGYKFLFIPWLEDDQVSYHLRENKDCIVVGHFGVNGSSVGPSEYQLSSGISPNLFKQHKIGILGHYHKYQWYEGLNWGYIGSISRVDFSERNDEKYFAHFNITDKGVNKKLINVNDRKFFQHKIYEKDDPKFDELLNWDEAMLTGSIVKLIFIGEENWYLGFNPNEIKNKILKLGKAHKLFVEHLTKSSGRFMMPEITLESNWAEGIELHCSAKKKPNMIELGKKILSEVQSES